ncbi:MAG TPA: hypothetical protein EYO88_04235 [Alphaproteobacteria bacterium]|nr:hypothetical protein [Alphaproteobacteria bacterium]
MAFVSYLQDLGALVGDLGRAAKVDHLGGHQPQRRMAMLVVVAVEEGHSPGTGLFQVVITHKYERG